MKVSRISVYQVSVSPTPLLALAARTGRERRGQGCTGQERMHTLSSDCPETAMTASTFDTLSAADKLRGAGLGDVQA